MPMRAREPTRSRANLHLRRDADRPDLCAQESDEDSELLRCQECDVRIHLDVSRPPRCMFCPSTRAEQSCISRAMRCRPPMGNGVAAATLQLICRWVAAQCLQPRIWKESDGVFCPRCITEEQ
jgi:hypothetical protein